MTSPAPVVSSPVGGDQVDDRPVRVLWLAKGLGRGGAEHLLVSTAAHLDTDRFQVEVAYLLPWKDALAPRLIERGIPVHCLDQTSALDPRWVARLRRLLASGHYDVIHTHMPIPAAAARLLAAGSGTALVHTEHNVWQRYRRPTYWANALTYRRNHAVLAVSAAVAESVRPRFVRSGAAVEVLHHGVDAATLHRGSEARDRARRTLGLPQDAPVIGTVGNLTPKKDQATLLRAVARVRHRLPDVRLVVAGGGPLEAQLRGEASALGLDHVVHFLGVRDDVPQLLPALDVFCLSSLHEGLSIALVEALGSGVPVVSTAVGGVPEVVTHEVDGLLVPPADPPRLAGALERVLTDQGLRQRLASAGLERSAAFDMRRAVQRIERVYDEVLADRR